MEGRPLAPAPGVGTPSRPSLAWSRRGWCCRRSGPTCEPPVPGPPAHWAGTAVGTGHFCPSADSVTFT